MNTFLSALRPGRFLVLNVLYWLVAISAHADAGNRSDFGRNNLGLWSHLTPFELQTLNSHELAINNDPDALLALYLLASGDVRQQEDFDRIRDQLNDWIKNQRQRVARGVDAKARAELLHLAMHENFFIPSTNTDMPKGYDDNQSQLSKIFTDKTYNCISSALLYIVLTRHFGFEPEGVLLPSHAFVQLNFRNGQELEVETTSRNGFNVLHDEKYYRDIANDQQSWYVERSLTPSSYEDYLQRRILSPVELGLENMWHQHTSPERMAFIDRMRVAEIRALLQPSNRIAQFNRLGFYLREFNQWHQSDVALLERMFNQIEPYLYSLNDATFYDDEFRTQLTQAQYAMAFVFAQGERREDGLKLAQSLLRELNPNSQENQSLQLKLFEIFFKQAGKKLVAGEPLNAIGILEGIEPQCFNSTPCMGSYAQVYQAALQSYSQEASWSEVTAIGLDYLARVPPSKQMAQIATTTSNAYLYWAQDLLQEAEIEDAKTVLRSCVDKMPLAGKACQENLDSVIAKDEQGLL